MLRFAALLLACLGFSCIAAPCDWQARLQDEDRPALQVTPEFALQRIEDDYDDADQSAGAGLARELLQRARTPLPVGDIGGRWKIRSIQVSTRSSGMSFAYAYPNFAATIERNDCGFDFAKTTGSQRHGGQLYALDGDERRLLLLGTAVVNRQPLRAYGPDNLSSSAGSDGEHAQNSVGHLWRIGPQMLVLLVDADERGFNLYQLTR